MFLGPRYHVGGPPVKLVLYTNKISLYCKKKKTMIILFSRISIDKHNFCYTTPRLTTWMHITAIDRFFFQHEIRSCNLLCIRNFRICNDLQNIILEYKKSFSQGEKKTTLRGKTKMVEFSLLAI